MFKIINYLLKKCSINLSLYHKLNQGSTGNFWNWQSNFKNSSEDKKMCVCALSQKKIKTCINRRHTVPDITVAMPETE